MNFSASSLVRRDVAGDGTRSGSKGGGGNSSRNNAGSVQVPRVPFAGSFSPATQSVPLYAATLVVPTGDSLPLCHHPFALPLSLPGLPLDLFCLLLYAIPPPLHQRRLEVPLFERLCVSAPFVRLKPTVDSCCPFLRRPCDPHFVP